MKRIAFRMKLHAGKEEEYQKRHDTIWPELKNLLKQRGISEYSIFLDPDSYYLFGVMTIQNAAQLEVLPDEPIMKKWWEYMKDLMETNPDNSPVSLPLKEVFYLS